MKEKQVILSYKEHEEMLQRIEDLEKSKLCTIDFNIREWSYRSNISSLHSIQVNSTEELKKIVEEIIENKKEYIENVYKEKLKQATQFWEDREYFTKEEYRRLMLELDKYKNKKWYKIWK